MIFQYKAYKWDGEATLNASGAGTIAGTKRHEVRDSIDAPDRETAIAEIKALGLYPVTVKSDDESFFSTVRKFARSKVPVRDQKFFFEGFAAMLSSNIPIIEALMASVERCTHKRYKAALKAVEADFVGGGKDLAVAFSRRPKEFTSLQVALIRAAEVAGALPEVLTSMAKMLDNLYQTQRQVRSATINPAIIAVVGFFSLLIVLTYVVPQMRGLTTGLNVSMPWPTQLVLDGSALMSMPITWVLLVLVIIGSPIGYAALMRNDDVAFHVESFYLKVPHIGPLIRQYHMTRIARTLATLLTASVPQQKALPLMIPLAGLVPFRRAIERIVAASADGADLSLSFRLEKVFDPVIVQYIALGAKTGDTARQLHHAADFLDREVRQRLDEFAKFIEPTLSSFVGSSLSVVLFTLYLPYYSIIDRLTRLGSGGF